jgi:hypothetical protein
MKQLLIAFLLIFSVSGFAGQMKEIYTETIDSVTSTLGLSEDSVEIETIRFVKIEGADLAVRTIVKNQYNSGKYDCLTLFSQVDNDFIVTKTQCSLYQ